MPKFLLFVALFISFTLAANAQVNPSDNHVNQAQSNQLASTTVVLTDHEGESWAFHFDPSRDVVYIDFEVLGKGMSMLFLRDVDSQEIVLREDVEGLPANTIFELDLSKYASGNYLVEVHSYTKVHTERILVQ